MVQVQNIEFPDRLFYDMENQVWYEPLADGTVRAGFTHWSANFMGGIFAFTPKRVGREFDKHRSFAVVEGGKWVGAARSAFAGTVVATNEILVGRPGLLNTDPFDEGWMLIVKPASDDWRQGLVTGAGIAPAFEGWFATGAYKERTE